jgi:hypothetical protein
MKFSAACRLLGEAHSFSNRYGYPQLLRMKNCEARSQARPEWAARSPYGDA